VLGTVPVLYPSRWRWSFHLFLGRPMFLFPFGPYFSACLGILSVPSLSTRCSHSRWYCFISRTVFCTPGFSLMDWFLSLPYLADTALKINLQASPSSFSNILSECASGTAILLWV
jgi:hypothetical protein